MEGDGTSMGFVDSAGTGGAFDSACSVVVEHLRSVLPMGMWAVTRLVEDRQVMLVVDPPEYQFEVGSELPLATSLCARMLAGTSPLVVPDVHTHSQTTGYVAPDGFTIRAYTGAVITAPDGAVFGTLCGWSPRPQPTLTDGDADLLQVFSTLLSTLLRADLALTEAHRNTERAHQLSDTDELTGLLNRRGWSRLMELEQQRQRRFGDPAGVITLDLDGLKHVNDVYGHHAGDELLRNAARVLTAHTRAGDVVARLGGDEFGVITAGATPAQIDGLTVRLQQALADAGVAASIGAAPVSLMTGYEQAWHQADQRLYDNKRQRR